MISRIQLANKEKTHFPKRELFLFYFLFTAAIYFVYKKPNLALPFFLFVLAWSWFSAKNYFWIAFFFLIIQAPAWFFWYTPTSHLPGIKVMPSISFSPPDFFTVMMLCKAFFLKKYINLKLKIPLTFLLVYFIFSFFWGVLFHSASLDEPINFIRPVFYTTWIIFFTAFMSQKEDIFKFFRLLFPVAFFVLFCQIYFLLNRNEFINLFDPLARSIVTTNTLTGELRSAIGLPGLSFLSYIGALFILGFKQKTGDKYVFFVATSWFFGVFLSATRSFFGFFLFIWLGVYSRKIKQLPKIVGLVVLILIILFSLIKLGVFSEEYLRSSLWARLSQVFDFISGKGAQIDTVANRFEQLKIMLPKISESLLFGYGFSDISNTYYNNNWGFFNTILMFGLVGFLFFIFLFISYFKMMLSALRKLAPNSVFREPLRVLIVSFCAILSIYFFNLDLFSLTESYKAVFITVFFAISEVSVRLADAERLAFTRILKHR